MRVNYEAFGEKYYIETTVDDELTPSIPDYSNSHPSTVILLKEGRSKYGFALDPNFICNEDLVFVCAQFYQSVTTSAPLERLPVPDGAYP